jgi:hypothetical protein
VLISQESIDLILAWEVGGGSRVFARALYEERYARPRWSGDDGAGLSIGIGYDLRHAKSWFEADFKTRLQALASPSDAYERLAGYVGKRGSREAVRRTRDITIPWEDAVAVFRVRTLPNLIDEAKRLFPGVERMGGHVWGALASAVAHRGVGADGHHHAQKESVFADLRRAVAAGDAKAVAEGIRRLKAFHDERVPKAAKDLERRREEEARLAESAGGTRSAA